MIEILHVRSDFVMFEGQITNRWQTVPQRPLSKRMKQAAWRAP